MWKIMGLGVWTNLQKVNCRKRKNIQLNFITWNKLSLARFAIKWKWKSKKLLMNSYWRLSLAQHFLCLSHPAKNCFPISISLNLNTIWRSCSFFVSIFLFLSKVHCFTFGFTCFTKWGPKILGWKRKNFISIHQTSPTTKRQQIQIIATADFLFSFNVIHFEFETSFRKKKYQ